MINILLLPFAFLLLQYVIGSFIVIILSLRAIQKYKSNAVTRSFFAFGITIAIWQILVFFHRTTTSPEDVINLFKIIGIVHPFAYGFYFLIFLNIWKTRMINLLCMIPSIIGSLVYGLYVDYNVDIGTFGWSYRQVTSSSLFDILVFGSTAIMITVLLITLIYLLLKSPSRDLRKRFYYILFAFLLFQTFGLFVTNFFLMPSNPNFPPLGGILYLTSFIIIYYQISPSKVNVVLTPRDTTDIPSALTDILESFYINLLSQSVDTLGSKYFKFLSYLRQWGLIDVIQLKNGKILLSFEGKGRTIERNQILSLIDISIGLLEKGELDQKYVKSLTDFINRNYYDISVDLIGILKKHERYLKYNKLLYDIGEGKLRLLFAPESFTDKDLERFSSPIKLTHQELERTTVLFKFISDTNYESKIEDFVREGIANGEKVYVFTRMESRVNSILKNLEEINLIFLSISPSSLVKINDRVKIVQITDISQILGTIMSMKYTDEESSVIFDNLTDFLLLTNFEQTYKMTRHALDLQASSRIHSLFLINKDAHSKEIIAAFESLFRITIE